MTAKKLILVLALVASASSAALAKMPTANAYAGAQAGTSGAIFEDAHHGAGAASQRRLRFRRAGPAERFAASLRGPHSETGTWNRPCSTGIV